MDALVLKQKVVKCNKRYENFFEYLDLRRNFTI